jgi:hypothetical protein
MRISIACAALLVAATSAAAESRLQGRYEVKLAGVTIGRAAVLLEINRDRYTAAGSAKVSGIMRAISKAYGTAAVRGQILENQVVPLTYSLTARLDKRPDEVRIVMAARTVREVSAQPPLSPAPDRVPITAAHRKDVLDPLSAALIIVPGSGDVISKQACTRTLPIFDGRYRFEIELSFYRIENVSGAKGYAGPAVVCNAIYRPIAGHRPARTATTYATLNNEIRVWLVPVAGTRALVPYRVTIGTILGTVTLQALALETLPVERAAATTAPK